MATTPHVDPPKPHVDPPKHADDKTPPKPPMLEPENAATLFKNGHRIAKEGDPQEKWISMSRAADGTAVLQMPITDELLETIKGGSYYLVDNQGA